MRDLTRRSFVAFGATVAATRMLSSASVGQLLPREDLVWTDVKDWPLEGRAFAERLAPYDRLPGRAQGVVRDIVWDLSRQSAGMLVRFATNSPELRVRYRLTSDRLAMFHMPATGVSGVDLYGHDGENWRWIDVTRPTKRDVQKRFFTGRKMNKASKFQLYLPLYNGIEKLEVGTAKGAELTPLVARGSVQKPIVCYGTSIMQGACASRPGMAWTSIMGRELDREVINLGLSGNGRMELEVGQFLAELEASAFVIDCLPNMTPKQVAQRAKSLVQQLRGAHKKTPILLVEDRTFTNAWFHTDRADDHRQRRQALRDAFAALKRNGVEGIHYLAGDNLLGDDGEAATDGSHPSDLGMLRQAKVMTEALRPLLL